MAQQLRILTATIQNQNLVSSPYREHTLTHRQRHIIEINLKYTYYFYSFIDNTFI